MKVLLTGTLCRAMGDLFYLALLDDRVVCRFVRSEAVDVIGNATRPPLASSPCTGPRLADVSRSASYCAPLVP